MICMAEAYARQVTGPAHPALRQIRSHLRPVVLVSDGENGLTRPADRGAQEVQ
jgi:hypothetical protein